MEKIAHDQARAQARAHIQLYLDRCPDGQHIELRAFRETEQAPGASFWIQSPAQIEGGLAWAEAMYAGGYAVYLGQNPRAESPGTKENVKQVMAAYADVDLYKTDKTRAEFDAFVASDALPLKPSLIVNSGGGLQVIYLFAPSEDKALWLGVQEKLKVIFDDFGAGHEVVTDEARVLRLTPFANRKLPDNPRPTEIEYLNDRELLTLAKTAEALGTSAEEGRRLNALRKSRVSTDANGIPALSGKAGMPPEVIPEHGNGDTAGRNSEVFKAAMRMYSAGFSDAETRGAMAAFNEARCQPPLDGDEFDTVLENARSCWLRGQTVSDEEREEKGKRIMEELEQGRCGSHALPALKIIKRGDMRKKHYEVIPDVIFGLAPGGMGKMDAISTGGKTTFILGMGLSMACGKPYLNIYSGEVPVKVLALLVENDEDHWSANDQTKIEDELGLTPEQKARVDVNFHAVYGNLLGNEYNGDEVPNLLSEKVRESLEAAIKAEGYKLVIIDTMSQAFPIENENDSGQANRLVIQPLRKIAKRTNCAFLILHHQGKVSEDSTGHAINLGRGSSAFNANADAVYTLKPVGSLTKSDQDRFATLIFTKARRPDRPGEKPLKLAKGSRVFTFCDEAEAAKAAPLTGAQKFAEFVKARGQVEGKKAVNELVAELMAKGEGKAPKTVRDWRQDALTFGLILEDGEFLKPGLDRLGEPEMPPLDMSASATGTYGANTIV